MESAQSWEFQQRSLQADNQNFWMVLGPLSFSLIYILILLMLHYLIHHKHRWGWHGAGDTKQEPSQLRMLL
jgi:hypothetical protein